MRVVLLDNIRGIGKVGDVKDVSDGYARNHLLPRQLARAASEGAIKQVELTKARKLESATLARAQAEEASQRLAGERFALSGPTNAKGTFFSALTPDMLADAISKKAGVHVAPNQLEMPSHIKTAGEYPVRVRLTDDVVVDVTLSAEPQTRP